jgi:hypothetical protein
MVEIYGKNSIPDEYQLNIYEYTTNGFLGLKYLINPNFDDNTAIEIANKLYEKKVVSIPNNQSSGVLFLVY